MNIDLMNELIEKIKTCDDEELKKIKAIFDERPIKHKRDMNDKLVSYMHLTNLGKESFYYTSDKEQIITNNTNSVIYYNGRIFNFENINNYKITSRCAELVDKNEMIQIINKIKTMYGKVDSSIEDVCYQGKKEILFSTNNGWFSFPKFECEFTRKLLDNPSFRMSEENPILFAESEKGFAYILSKNTKL